MLVYGYNQLSSVRQAQEDSEKIEKAGDFNKTYEAYNKDGLYGSELLSLANKIEDYNSKNLSGNGYQGIELDITINQIRNAQVYKSTSYNASTLTSCYTELAKKIRETNKTYKGKNISYWAGSSSDLRSNFDATTTPSYTDMVGYIRNYNALVTERDDIARKSFKCTKVEYSKENGRIIKMTYKEK